MATKEFDTLLNENNIKDNENTNIVTKELTKKNNIGYKLYFYLVPILYTPLFLFFFHSSILLNQFLYISCLFVLIFNFMILKKLKKLYPDLLEYKYMKKINWFYIVGYLGIVMFAFINSLSQYLPGGV